MQCGGRAAEGELFVRRSRRITVTVRKASVGQIESRRTPSAAKYNHSLVVLLSSHLIFFWPTFFGIYFVFFTNGHRSSWNR